MPNPSERNRGIIGPTRDEAAPFNKLKGSIVPGKLARFGPPVGGLIGFGAIAGGIACAAPQVHAVPTEQVMAGAEQTIRAGQQETVTTGTAAARQTEEAQKPTPRPTITPVAVGGPNPIRTGDKELDAIAEKLSDPLTRAFVPESDIARWNKYKQDQATKESATRAPATVTSDESPKPVIETVSQEEALKKVKKLIDEVENPNQEIVDKYGISPDQLKSNRDLILQGAPDRRIPGLNDVATTVEQGDLPLARTQLLVVFTNWFWGRDIPLGQGKPGQSDRIQLSEAEKKQADPDNIVFGTNPKKAPIFSGVRKGAALDTIQAIRGLPSAN